MPASAQVVTTLRSFFKDAVDGFIEITHNGFAILGLVVVCLGVVLLTQPNLRHTGEAKLHEWLQERKVAALGTPIDPVASERATATNPKELPKEQAAVAYWLSKKYNVAPEPLAVLVAEAYDLGQRNKLDPTLILAIMAIESSFNPFAQSSVGAQGLMQVMTRVHTDKYEHFGGQLAAFDPVTNLRVGVKVLKECIARAGSVEGGLRHYVGAANLPHDGGYAAKVLAEHQRIRQASGRPLQTPSVPLQDPALQAKAPTLIRAPAAVTTPTPTAAVSNNSAVAKADTKLLVATN